MTIDLAATDFALAITHDLCDQSCVVSTICPRFQLFFGPDLSHDYKVATGGATNRTIGRRCHDLSCDLRPIVRSVADATMCREIRAGRDD